MAWSFGESWDLYAAAGDAVNGYWDSGTGGGSIQPGRFSGSQGMQGTVGAVFLAKSSPANDAVHHLAVAFFTSGTIIGSTMGFYLQLLDGTTGQCAISFRSDGAIVLSSGSAAGTVLATYTGAFTASSTWYQFEFEVVINNATGRFRVRKNGNVVDDFDSGAVLNTRGGTANNYANKLQVGSTTNNNTQKIDDLFWRSDASAVAWLGDIRCYTRMPATDQSVQFSGAGTRSVALSGGLSNASPAANRVLYSPFTLPVGGTVESVTFTTNPTAYPGGIKCSIYNDNGSGAPGTILATATNTLTAPPVSTVTAFTFSPPVTVAPGQKIWVAFAFDTTGSSGAISSINAIAALQGTTTYASFPVANPTSLSVVGAFPCSFIVVSNCGLVSEAQQDALTTYVYDSTPGDADFYGIANIPVTPASVIATTVRAYVQKSDAGTRTAAVQLKSGVTTVASPTLVLSTSGWQWAWRTDITDPNTGAAWTAAAVNNAQIGPKVIA